jgi:hypothetical protein
LGQAYRIAGVPEWPHKTDLPGRSDDVR